MAFNDILRPLRKDGTAGRRSRRGLLNRRRGLSEKRTRQYNRAAADEEKQSKAAVEGRIDVSIRDIILQEPRLTSSHREIDAGDRTLAVSQSTRSTATIVDTDEEGSLAPAAVHEPDGQSSLFDEHYELLPDVKGSGIAGEVRSCVHRATSELCAVKTMSKHRVRRGDRIDREIQFLKEVDHPNVIKMYDVYETEDEVKIVTEMCSGGELFDVVAERARIGRRARRRKDGTISKSISSSFPPMCFSEREAARVIHSLLSAVSYLHSRDIVHRDVKPENVLFANEGSIDEVKLIDFGLSIRHSPNDRPLSNPVGTAYYMAPEVLDGRYDRSCDLWSAGVVAYILLSGRPPFNGLTDEDIFEKIRKGKYVMEGTRFWEEGVSELARDFIRCLLEYDPRRRWNADMALRHAWLEEARGKGGE